jgi:hypothetical protein
MKIQRTNFLIEKDASRLATQTALKTDVFKAVAVLY